MALVHAMRKRSYKIMIMDVKCAFLYGLMHRNVNIELPHTDLRYGDASVGKSRRPWPVLSSEGLAPHPYNEK